MDINLKPSDVTDLLPLIAASDDEAIAAFLQAHVFTRGDAYFLIQSLAACAASSYADLFERQHGRSPDFWGIDAERDTDPAIRHAGQLIAANLNSRGNPLSPDIKGHMEAILDAPREHSAAVLGAVMALLHVGIDLMTNPDSDEPSPIADIRVERSPFADDESADE